MRRPLDPKDNIFFTKEQLEYLNKNFPENTVFTDSPYEVYRRMGYRQVIQFISKLVPQSNIPH